MSYGLNVEMHKQTEICKRLDAIIRQVLPFLSAEVSELYFQNAMIIRTFKHLFMYIYNFRYLTFDVFSFTAPNTSCNGS